ncbi:MAG TPA: inositol monophosphatase family protein [Sandaracinaceae bacterium LLY-WYZ-13_1]|nr:inositol monophosphatase family protein [Sandaracinaceae bacterium LLY-WYZ-13_1]
MVDDAQLPALRDGAEDAAREAGALLLAGFRADPSIRTKRTTSDLVTEHDERCERLLRERLASLLPEASVVGEEQGGDARADLVWYVDPLDGTSNFAHGHPWFSTSIGLWRGETPLVGVVHAPAMGLTYAAARGHGLSRQGAPARCSETASLDAALLATGFAADRATRPDNNYREFVALDAVSHGVRRCASAALELSLVADGGYDGFWDRGLGPWDLAAGVLFVREGGGRVTDLEGGPVSLERGEIVASNGPLHDALRNALAHARALPPIVEVT